MPATRPRRSRIGTYVTLTLFTGLLWYGCSTDQSDVAGPTSVTLQTRQFRIQQVMAIQDAHTPSLLEVPGVIGTATSLNEAGEPVVRVYSTEEDVSAIPAELDGVPVVVKRTEMIVALQDPTSRFPRPVPTGVSVGHPAITAGTIGARVKDVFGNVYILSNNHVLANQNAANIDDSALQPGPADGGQDPADRIGGLHDFEVMAFSTFFNQTNQTNQLDAAIALSSAALVGTSTPAGGYGTPGTTVFGDGDNDGLIDDVTSLLGLSVKKYGRTTGLTQGTITEINVTINVCYQASFICWVWATMTDQVGISGAGFSGGGDSGSLIVSDDPTNSPVGLLFAGGGNMTFANRIDLVLDRFSVTIDGSAPGPITDVAIIDVSAPADVVGGQTAAVNVTVKNVGDLDAGAFSVSLDDVTDGGNIGGTAVGGLLAGEETMVNFNWNTTGVSFGSHTLRAEHDLADDFAGNNSGETAIEVLDPNPPPPPVGPVVDACQPDGAPRRTRVTVIVRGSGFEPGLSITFGPGIYLLGGSFISSETLVIDLYVLRRAARGPRNVIVTNPDGQSGTGVACFTVI